MTSAEQPASDDTDSKDDDSERTAISSTHVKDPNDQFWTDSLQYLINTHYDGNEAIAKEIIAKLQAYYDDEQYEDTQQIIADISGDTCTESTIVTEICDECSLSPDKLWCAMRGMYRLKTTKNSNETQSQSSAPSQSPVLLPTNVNWSLDEQLILKTRNYIQEQCHGVIQKGTGDDCLVKIIAVGRQVFILYLFFFCLCFSDYIYVHFLFFILLYIYIYFLVARSFFIYLL